MEPCPRYGVLAKSKFGGCKESLTVNVDLELSRSLWTATAPDIEAAALDADLETDIVVVGGGIAGLSVAYELTKAGRNVVVIDRGKIGRGMTARTSAHLTSEIDDYYSAYTKLRGIEEARAYYASQSAAIDRIEEIARIEQIECDFSRIDGYLFHTPGTDAALLDREIAACHDAGFTGVTWTDGAPLSTAGSAAAPCLRFPNQARFHPLAYLAGLARAILAGGGRLYANAAVQHVEEKDAGVVVSTADGRRVRATAAIVATNSPINDWIALHTKQAPYRTYVIAGEIPKGAVVDALYWDTADPYHYVRIQPGASADVLIVGGEDHKTGLANDQNERFARLEAWARLRVPDLRGVTHRWSGQVMEPVDYAPYVGRNHGNARVFVATGDSGEGLTTGVVAGMLLRDLVLDRDNPWIKAYDPQRVTISASGKYIKENATMAANLTQYVTGGDVPSLELLKAGEGAVIRDGTRKLAAYRDGAGTLHVRSAVCSHAGCIVQWNALEKCWDCPCHGSQFAVDGEPLNGPAIYPLATPDGVEGESPPPKAARSPA